MASIESSVGGVGVAGVGVGSAGVGSVGSTGGGGSNSSNSVLPPPRYASHEFASPYLPCSSGMGNNNASTPTSTSTTIDRSTSSPRCGNTMKPVGTASINGSNSSISGNNNNHTPAPSPSYPIPNSWSNFDPKTAASMGGTGASIETKGLSIPCIETNEKRQRKPGVCVFTSKMANEAYESIQQCRYESILAWHEANCRPSTSTADESSPSRFDGKRKSTDKLCRTPDGGGVHSGSPKLKKQTSDNNARVLANDHMAGAAGVSSSSDMLVSDDVDTNATSDNPLRRMERMTQDSLFEPPAKISRGASNDVETVAATAVAAGRKTEDDEPDRESKLAKLSNFEKLMNSKNRLLQPQCSQVQWDRMMQDQEQMKMATGYSQQVAPNYGSQGVISGPPPYQIPSHGMPPGMHPFRRAPFMGPISPHVMSPVPPNNGPAGPVMDVMGGTGMAMPQAMRPSLNPPPYNIHMAPEGYIPLEFAQSSFSSQAYPMSMSSTVSPAYSSMFPPVNGAPVPSRGYAMYGQGPRPMYGPEKVLPDMWGQQLPQPLSNLEARVPNQKIQYHPNGTVIDENLNDNVNNMNSFLG